MPRPDRSVVVHRPLQFDFRGVPRHWLGGNAIATHVANAIHALFPAGERFGIRSIRRFSTRLRDPLLAATVRAFVAQEGSHARAHEAQLEALELQGYAVRPFLAFCERMASELVAPIAPPELSLAVTAALEHYTAILATVAFAEGVLDDAHPTMKDFLLWHAAEEIEHKSVAFDVLTAMNPSYELRMAGMSVATVALFGAWACAFVVLVLQEKRMSRAPLVLPAPRGPSVLRVVLRGLSDYTRRDFHPDDREGRSDSEAYLESVGLLDGVTTATIA